MSLGTILLFIALAVFIVLMVVWWLRRHPRGLEWVTTALLLSFALSYVFSLLVQVVPYRAGCLGFCQGWRGYPLATHTLAPGGLARFMPAGFVLDAGIYFAVLLVFGALVLQLARLFRISQRRKRWQLLFALIFVVAPWALSPTFTPTPQPDVPLDMQRLVINATRDWYWQFRSGHISERALALEDVRLHPDGSHYRVCFRAYTWFYIPLHHVYIDLEPAGVRATSGGVIPLSASCWVQP